jgi:purine-binding chemotaxis protein CheW
MQQLFLIAVIAGTEVAISSECVESVVAVGEVIQVPRSEPLVAGLIALRSRVLTLIDCQYAVTGTSETHRKSGLAVIANIMGHPYALMVEAVKDVVSVEEKAMIPVSKLDPSWAKIAVGVVEIEGRMVMQLAPDLLLAPSQALAA